MKNILRYCQCQSYQVNFCKISFNSCKIEPAKLRKELKTKKSCKTQYKKYYKEINNEREYSLGRVTNISPFQFRPYFFGFLRWPHPPIRMNFSKKKNWNNRKKLYPFQRHRLERRLRIFWKFALFIVCSVVGFCLNFWGLREIYLIPQFLRYQIQILQDHLQQNCLRSVGKEFWFFFVPFF